MRERTPGDAARGRAGPGDADRAYRRASARAFATVPFYRDQCARAGRPLAEPEPTPTAELPDPPHTLLPYGRPWSPADEPPLWTDDAPGLAAVLALAGCTDASTVLEVRGALLDRTRLPRPGPWWTVGRRFTTRRGWPTGRPYGVLLDATAVVASPDRRAELNAASLARAARTPGAWVVGPPDEVVARADPAGWLRPVRRLPVAAAAEPPPRDGPAVLFEPVLGYLGALVPSCRLFHVDSPRVYARDRDGVLTLSLPGRRRPTLLDLVPPGAERVTTLPCPRHATPVLRPR